MKTHSVPQSGKHGLWVYYVLRGKQCRRRWVKPRDPRTSSQLRARRVFGAASKLWSDAKVLTDAEQDAYYAAGAKIQSRPRLDQSGPLTGPQYYVGRICKGAARFRGRKACRTKSPRFDTQALVPQNVTRPTSGTDAGPVRNTKGTHASSQGRAGRPAVTRTPSQGLWYQRVMQPARGCHRSGFVVLRQHQPGGNRYARYGARGGMMRAAGRVAEANRDLRQHKLWQGA